MTIPMKKPTMAPVTQYDPKSPLVRILRMSAGLKNSQAVKARQISPKMTAPMPAPSKIVFHEIAVISCETMTLNYRINPAQADHGNNHQQTFMKRLYSCWHLNSLPPILDSSLGPCFSITRKAACKVSGPSGNFIEGLFFMDPLNIITLLPFFSVIIE